MKKEIELPDVINDPAMIEEISFEVVKKILARIASILPMLLLKEFSGNSKPVAVSDEYLSIQQASGRFNKPVDYFYRNQSVLPFMKKDNGRWRISVRKYEKYFDNL